ncbi:hypothetical protein ACFE04_010645 [Oxalis oulophora]
MPPDIGTLRKLRFLPKFVVGKGEKNSIKELKDLTFLRGRLSLYGLDNIEEVQHVRTVNLKEKHGLDELNLVWRDEFCGDSQNQMQVLHFLRPHQRIKHIRIVAYKGTCFPAWVGDPSFSNITRLTVINCRKIVSLPSIGKLPSLKHLYIKGLDGVEKVGSEFFDGASFCDKTFPCLETLSFVNMFRWEEWTCPTNAEDGGFPHLNELVLQNCPKLLGNLPTNMPSLLKLEVCNCPLLTTSLGTLPCLRVLILDECSGECLRKTATLNSLVSLKIKRVSGLSCCLEGLVKLLHALETLHIESCNELTCLWEYGAEPEKLLCLRSLLIANCPMFVSFSPEALNCLKSLRSLAVISCEALENLPDLNKSCIEELRIEQCPLMLFPSGKLPSTLKKLEIVGCKNLESLPEGVMHNNDSGKQHLEVLSIQGCSYLKNFPHGEFPSVLRKLEIKNCMRLEGFSDIMLRNTISRAIKLLGLELEPLFNEPYLSNSLQDFWGRRWNLTVTNVLRPTVYDPTRMFLRRNLKNKEWARFGAVLATFLVSGIMHEVMFYYIGRVIPTGEVTCFFLLHGVCLGLEDWLRKRVGDTWRLPRVVSTVLTVGFVLVTALWLFMPQFTRNKLDERAFEEYAALGRLVKRLSRRFVGIFLG